MPPSAFPSSATVGRKPNKYLKHDLDWKSITVESVFEDKGSKLNQSAPAPVQRWTLEWRGLSEAQAKVLDDHYDSAGGPFAGFDFTEYRNVPWTGTTGSTFTGVRYESYTKDHNRVLHNQTRTIVLIKRPV